MAKEAKVTAIKAPSVCLSEVTTDYSKSNHMVIKPFDGCGLMYIIGTKKIAQKL